MPRLVPEFLILMHQLVRASVPLMKVARSTALQTSDYDPLAAGLAEYFESHIEEEKDHDEWLLQDFDDAGIGRHKVLARTPSHLVASLVGAQYYWIYHHHPIALLGYIRLLEGNPPSAEHIDRLEQLADQPECLFRTYRLHGQLDPQHLDDFDAMYDRLPLPDEYAQLVSMSAFNTAHLLSDCLRDLMRKIESQ